MTSVAVFLLALGLFYVQAASIPGRERRSEDSDACKVDNWIQYKEAEYGLYKSNKKFTFDEGVDACGRCNWALPVTIHSASEMEFVKSLNSENKPFWLGYTSLYSDGSYWWMDGEESNYTDWKKGEPDNIASDSKIATSDVNCSYVTKEGQWRDHRCDQTKRVICKRMIDIFHPEIPVDMSNTTDDGSVSGNEGEEIPAAPVSDYMRTVLLVRWPTWYGQYIFIKGGVSRENCGNPNTDINNCSIPILLLDQPSMSANHTAKYDAWSVGDNYLGWYGAEPGQGTYEGEPAMGSPAIWTTDNENDTARYSSFNEGGPGYWLLDMYMDCSMTNNNTFEFKPFYRDSDGTGHWDNCIAADQNYEAECGAINVYERQNC